MQPTATHPCRFGGHVTVFNLSVFVFFETNTESEVCVRERHYPLLLRVEPISPFSKRAILLVFVAQSTSHRCKSCVAFLFWVLSELHIPKTTKMHTLITRRAVLARQQRLGGVRAREWCKSVSSHSAGHLGHARCSLNRQTRVGNSDFGGYGRAQ